MSTQFGTRTITTRLFFDSTDAKVVFYECSESDVERLRSVGFDDKAILDAALTVAYFSYVNRLVLVLGVEVEKDHASTCNAVAEES